MQQKQRRYDIDWWRVIAILAVYLHHVCMPFNGDKFHIMNAESSTVLDDIMVFFEQIRLPLLFLISGTGTVFAFSKRSSWQFIKERSYRLLVPLIFGVLVIVPPQTYFENIDDFNSYGQFYGRLGAYLQVNHLWFIENLFYISIVCIPLVLFLRSESSVKFRRAIESWSSSSYGIFLWVIPLIVVTVVSKIYFPEDSKSIANLSSSLFYGYFFVAGIVFANSPKLWEFLRRYRKANLYAAITAALFFYGYYYLPDAMASAYLSLGARWAIWHGVSAWVSWSVVTTLLGYGQIWFKTPSTILKYANEAIYPFYVLHQTAIVICAFYIVKMEASIGVKAGLLLLTSFVSTMFIYVFLVRPFKVTRVLFGMRRNGPLNEFYK